jgi:predicted MFS family arabinose efflux permease
MRGDAAASLDTPQSAIAAADAGARPAWILAFGAALFAMLAMQMASIGFSPLLPSIQQSFGMTFSQIGLFTGIYGLLALALSVPAGLTIKRIGERAVLMAGLTVIAIGLVLLSRADGFGSAMAGRAVWIAGYRFSFVGVLTAIALTCPPSLKGRSMGILGATSSIASVVGAPLGTTIEEDFGWRGGIVAYSVITMLGVLVVWLFYRARSDGAAAADPHGLGGAHTASPATTRAPSVFRMPIVWALCALLGMGGMGVFSATYFVPSAAKGTFGVDNATAAGIISTGYFVAIFANLLFGYLMDRYNKWTVMAVLVGIYVPACFAMASANLGVFRVASALVLALGFTTANQIYGIAGEVIKGRETGNVMGVVSLGSGVMGYIGPQMLGVLRDWTGGFSAGWVMLGIVGGITLTEILVLKRVSQRTQAAAAA